MRSEDLSLPDTSGSDPAVGVSRPADLSHPSLKETPACSPASRAGGAGGYGARSPAHAACTGPAPLWAEPGREPLATLSQPCSHLDFLTR